jgi:hypothetical protein
MKWRLIVSLNEKGNELNFAEVTANARQHKTALNDSVLDAKELMQNLADRIGAKLSTSENISTAGANVTEPNGKSPDFGHRSRHASRVNLKDYYKKPNTVSAMAISNQFFENVVRHSFAIDKDGKGFSFDEATYTKNAMLFWDQVVIEANIDSSTDRLSSCRIHYVEQRQADKFVDEDTDLGIKIGAIFDVTEAASILDKMGTGDGSHPRQRKAF